MKDKILIGVILIVMAYTCALMYIGLSDTEFKLPKLPKINILNAKKTLVCTKTETDEDGFETKTTITVNHKNNKIIKVQQEDIQTVDEETIDFVYGLSSLFMMGFNEIEGMNVIYEKNGSNSIRSVFTVDYSKLDIEALEKITNSMSPTENESKNKNSILYNKKSISLKEFKKEYLEGYTCN